MPPRDRAVQAAVEVEKSELQPMIFSEFLKELEGGAVDRRASREIERLVEAVRTHRKAGKFVLEIKVAPATPKDASQVFVTPERVEAKLPKPSADPSIYFTTHTNTLSRENPRQLRMRGAGFEEEADDQD